MNCNNIRKYFHAFLDDELDVEKNIEVLAHLDMCCECSAKIEKERSLQRKVKETVCAVKAPDYLRQMVLEKVEHKPNFFILFKEKLLLKRNRIPLAGIAAVLVLVVSFLATRSNLEKDDILHITEEAYHNYVMKQLDPDILSQDAESIVDYFQNQAGLNVNLPGIKENVRLTGATLAKIKGIRVPLVFYMYDDVPMVLFVNCDNDSQSEYVTSLDFSKMEKVMVNKTIMYTDVGFCGSCQVIGWKEGGNQYVMISMLNSAKMMKVLTEV